jgi:cytochrome c peroxidase
MKPRSLPCWIVFLALVACGRPAPTEPRVLEGDDLLRARLLRAGVTPIPLPPPQDPARVALGRVLFFDPILSGNRDVACATCHHPAFALGDGLTLPVGTGGTGLGPVRRPGPGRGYLPRHAPSLLNAGLLSNHAQALFWDGRLLTLGRPLTGPIAEAVLNRGEMRGNPGDVDALGQVNELALIPDAQESRVLLAIMDRLRAIPEYVRKFSEAFPETPADQLEFQHAASAVAAFMTEAFTRMDTPFDRYLRGDDGALDGFARSGALMFFLSGNCARCHHGPLLGGNDFASTGAPQIGPGMWTSPPLDLGRGEWAERAYPFRFRVPPLRNVELTAPYMHSGGYATLDAVVRHYSAGARFALYGYDNSHVAPEFRELVHSSREVVERVVSSADGRAYFGLRLTDDHVLNLVAFLRSLTDPSARDLTALIPDRVPSGLPVPR